jgi:hypothetical protein
MTSISDINRQCRVSEALCCALAEQIEPDDVGTALHHFLAAVLARILIFDALFRHGKSPPEVAEDYRAGYTQQTPEVRQRALCLSWFVT